MNEANHWELAEYNKAEEMLFIQTINEHIALGDIYEGVKLGNG